MFFIEGALALFSTKIEGLTPLFSMKDDSLLLNGYRYCFHQQKGKLLAFTNCSSAKSKAFSIC
jgi:hypothetical protein